MIAFPLESSGGEDGHDRRCSVLFEGRELTDGYPFDDRCDSLRLAPR